MAVVSNFTKNWNYGFFRPKSWPSGQLHEKNVILVIFGELMDVGSNFMKDKNFGFFRAKSWSSGHISRENVIWVFFHVTHGRWVKFNEKIDFRFFSR
jgi:hypothetical protein